MASFVHFINKARLSLMPRPDEGLGKPIEKIREHAVDRQLSSFNKEFSVYYADLGIESQALIQSIFNEPSFQHNYLNTEEKTNFLLQSFNNNITGFSPLHPAYPLINTFNDCQVNLEKINSDTLENQEKVLLEVFSIIE